MLENTCCSCGRPGHIPDRYAGRRVTCERCGAVNIVADPNSEIGEVVAVAWVAAMDPSSELASDEVDIRG
jgi:hypothetical protein